MRWRGWIVAPVVAVFAATAAANAADVAGRRFSVDLAPGKLNRALQELSIAGKVGLLFAPDVVGDRSSPRVSGRMSIDEALRRLLEGSGLAFRRTAAGTIVISAPEKPDAALAIPEILVVARRSQNNDIRRNENDIQPYQIVDPRRVTTAQTDTVGQFLRDRLTLDAHGLTPAQDPGEQGSNRSSFNLRGLGANETLILVDGARMPGIPSQSASNQFDQPDLNGMPLFAIDRIETLTATSGGIYGPGATGGVINVVLKRDYRGAQLSSSLGVTDRGDAARRRVEGRIGFTPDDGRTDVMIVFSRAVDDGLRAGDRDYAQRARRVRISRSPANFEREFPGSAGVFVIGARSTPQLALVPSLGGQSLGSSYTFLPLGYDDFSRSAGALLANAGNIAAALAPDSDHSKASILNETRAESAILGLRHDFGGGVEGYVDLIDLRNRAHGYSDVSAVLFRPRGAPGNPFDNNLYLEFPLPGYGLYTDNRIRTSRLTAGAIVELGGGWKTQAGYSLGRVRSDIREESIEFDADYGEAISSGKSVNGKPVLNPFGNWNTFADALQSYRATSLGLRKQSLFFRDASLRIAGPLFETSAGPASLTLLAERRREGARKGFFSTSAPDFEDRQDLDPFSKTVSSLYGEMRWPILSDRSRIGVLRGLEVQFAVRYDRTATFLPRAAGEFGEEGPIAPQKNRYGALGTVAGVRLRPIRHLMLRASLATGSLPPAPDQLRKSSDLSDVPYDDPRRPGAPLGSDGPYRFIESGSSRLRPEQARTWSFGLVLNPEADNRPRISLDYTRIEKRDEIYADRQGDIDYILANEAIYPDRVTRAPLTDADRAAGYSVGAVAEIDTTALNIGRTRIEALDLKAEWDLPLGVARGVRLYGAATWMLRLDRRAAPDVATVSYTGFSDGPLKWRANAGIEAYRGPWAIGLNGQFFDAYYDITALEALDGFDRARPGMRIPRQLYFDLSARYGFRLPAGAMARTLDVRFGIQNVLDHRPPTVASTWLGYSVYGDPRGRRFDLTMTASF